MAEKKTSDPKQASAERGQQDAERSAMEVQSKPETDPEKLKAKRERRYGPN
ncbi:hypothetical protein KBP30_01035 [Streptomyces sp. Go40/10]|uniref:hypothetical protein n=1 Tax=Streptomyces sp. Go40/10 TaxID=2825844 RepID=UPI001E362D35|nr:hypothetical protein [Streptomyces sp. Go40/10]UFQ99892.1 hypothetical protein KBP30_01035 [Streptomyces sp. Go40/10]